MSDNTSIEWTEATSDVGQKHAINYPIVEGPAGDSVEGLCECGHRKLHPADLNGDISRNGKRSPNPKCPRCGKHALRDRHGYWCNGCQLEVLAS